MENNFTEGAPRVAKYKIFKCNKCFSWKSNTKKEYRGHFVMADLSCSECPLMWPGWCRGARARSHHQRGPRYWQHSTAIKRMDSEQLGILNFNVCWSFLLMNWITFDTWLILGLAGRSSDISLIFFSLGKVWQDFVWEHPDLLTFHHDNCFLEVFSVQFLKK